MDYMSKRAKIISLVIGLGIGLVMNFFISDYYDGKWGIGIVIILFSILCVIGVTYSYFYYKNNKIKEMICSILAYTGCYVGCIGLITSPHSYVASILITGCLSIGIISAFVLSSVHKK